MTFKVINKLMLKDKNTFKYMSYLNYSLGKEKTKKSLVNNSSFFFLFILRAKKYF